MSLNFLWERLMEKVILADDLLHGVGAISKFTGLNPRRIFYLAMKRELPLFKVGHLWCARRTTLVAHFDNLEREARQKNEHRAA
jgi:hypothetical protein